MMRSRTRTLWVIVALALVVTASLSVAPAAAATPMSWEYISTSHAAVWNDGSDSMTVKIKTSGPVAKVVIDDLGGGTDGLKAGDQTGRIRLYDDGTHGDAKAGDSMFTRSGVSVKASWWDWAKCIWVELHSATGNVKKSDWSAFQIMALDRKHEVPLTKLDDYMRVSGRVANLKVNTDVYQPKSSYWQRKSPKLKTVTKRFYKRYPDRFDFLYIWNQQDVAYNWGHKSIRNNVSGIGQPKFNNTRNWGSMGRLLGINFLGRTGEYGVIEETLSHWAPYLDGMGLSRYGWWREINIRGYLGGLGFKWLTDRKFEITWVPWGRGPEHRMAWLELYLAGLAKTNEVPKVKRLKGIDMNGVEVGDIVTAKSVVKKSISQIVSKYGKRKPTYATSRKSFRVGAVLVTVNRFATPAEMTRYHLTMGKLGSTGAGSWSHPTTESPSWNWATRGRSKMNTTLGAPK